MAEVLGFDRKGAKRVVDAVRKVEGMAAPPAAPRPAAPPSAPRYTAKGVASQTIPYRSYGNVAVWAPVVTGVDVLGDPIIEEQATGEIIKAYAWCLLSTKEIKSGDEVMLIWVDGRWYAVQCTTCPEDMPPSE